MCQATPTCGRPPLHVILYYLAICGQHLNTNVSLQMCVRIKKRLLAKTKQRWYHIKYWPSLWSLTKGGVAIDELYSSFSSNMSLVILSIKRRLMSCSSSVLLLVRMVKCRCYKFCAHTPLYNIEFDFSQFSESVLRAGCSEKLVHVIKIAGGAERKEGKIPFCKNDLQH